MNCITCEVRRARLYALAMSVLGKGPQYVADTLRKRYGGLYFVAIDTVNCRLMIKRQNTVTPSKPYIVFEKHIVVAHRA